MTSYEMRKEWFTEALENYHTIPSIGNGCLLTSFLKQAETLPTMSRKNGITI